MAFASLEGRRDLSRLMVGELYNWYNLMSARSGRISEWKNVQDKLAKEPFRILVVNFVTSCQLFVSLMRRTSILDLHHFIFFKKEKLAFSVYLHNLLIYILKFSIRKRLKISKFQYHCEGWLPKFKFLALSLQIWKYFTVSWMLKEKFRIWLPSENWNWCWLLK